MFKREIVRLFSASSIFILLAFSGVYGQVEEHELPPLRRTAIEEFEAGEYDYAAINFNKLLRQFPEDPMYRYYAGICKVELDSDLEQAVELLYFASTRGVPVDVYYYLGEAYRKLYDFDKAKRYFTQFDREASRSESKEKHSKLRIRSALRAQQITSSYNPFDLLNVTFLNLNDPLQYGQIRMRGGDLSKKPESLISEKEEKNDLNGLMFLPKKIERGDLVFFSGMEKSGKSGYQILQAKKGNAGKWVDVKSIDAVNTEMNEILPYYDPVGQDIYFASDGLEGLGGFDLYRSHFNEELGQWTEPVNLGFPVNSAYDDYLFLPGTDLGMAMVFSGRQIIDNAVAVYRLQLSEPKESLSTASPREIREIANFGGRSIEATNDFTELEQGTQDSNLEQEDSLQEEETSEDTMNEPAEKDFDDSYQNLISRALEHQTVSDSLTELASQARVKVRDSDDPNDRWIYQKQILVWEKKANEEQAEADTYFKQVAEFNKPKKSDVIEVDTVINGMTVFKHVLSDSIRDKAQNVFQPQEDNKVEKKSGFEIMEESPYNEGHPIPMDVKIPGGTFYRIQLGVYSKPVAFDAFGGLTPISAENIKDRNLIKYYAGHFIHYEDVQSPLSAVRSAGFKDAFIVAWYNGSKMSLEKVRKLEK